MIKKKIIETQKGRLLVIGGLPEDAHWLEPNEGGHPNEFVYESNNDDDLTFLIPAGFWKLLGKLSEIKEEEAKKIVDGNNDGNNDTMWYDYAKPNTCFFCFTKNTAIESLQSLIDINMPLNNKYDNDVRPANTCGPIEYLEEDDEIFHNPILFFETLNR